MTWELLLTVFLIGFIGSFISGLVGIGGTIVKYPMLLYIPPLLGVGAFSAHEVSGISAVQVLFAALGGMWAFRKGGYLHKSLVLTMGGSILLGSLIGGFGSKWLSGDLLNVVYAVLASMAAVMMLLPRRQAEDGEVLPEQVTFHKPLAASAAFVVGGLAGVIGAGGAFLLMPVMLVLLKIPTRIAIATSLAVTFLSSIGTAAGKIATGQVLFWPAVTMIVASLLASSLGAHVSKKVHTKWLQAILAVLILATAVHIWWTILR